MQVGFIGLGNVGAKLAGSLLRNNVSLSVHDLDADAVLSLVANGARDGVSASAMMRDCDLVITCLPSPSAVRAVVEEMLPEVRPGKVWMETSTNDAHEVISLGAAVIAKGGQAAECPVSGGCH